MKCLVATANYLLLVDVKSASIVQLQRSMEDFYGISWFPEDPRLIVSKAGLLGSPNDNFETLARSEKGYLLIGDHPTPGFLSAPHQITCASDGRIVCTNTGRNSVVAIDLARPKFFHEVRLSDCRWDRWDPVETSGDHINSVFQRGGRLHVIAHGHNKGSRLATLSYPDMEILSIDPIANLTGLHNVWIGDDGEGLTCASHQGGIADVRSGNVVWTSGASVYTRGMAVSDDFILVGESAYTARSDRQHAISGLWLIDRKTMRTEDYLCLGPFGGVHEVRLLDVPDHAHHGAPFAGLESLVQVPPLAAIRNERVRATKAAQDRMSFWNHFRDVLGAVSIEADDWLAEREGYTCLVVQTAAAAADSIAFDYELTEGDGMSHVSVVLGFEGGHQDTSMTALLIQQFHQTATLRLWQSVNGEWTSASEPLADDLPLAGTIRAVLFADGISISVSGSKPLQISNDQLRFGTQPLGVRWSRGRVRISLPEQLFR